MTLIIMFDSGGTVDHNSREQPDRGAVFIAARTMQKKDN